MCTPSVNDVYPLPVNDVYPYPCLIMVHGRNRLCAVRERCVPCSRSWFLVAFTVAFDKGEEVGAKVFRCNPFFANPLKILGFQPANIPLASGKLPGLLLA